jgi:predicted DNA-binding transcriptional regulator AlpA
MPEELISHKEAARCLGRSPYWLYTRAQGLGIPRVRIGGRWGYRYSEIEGWLESNRASTPQQPRSSTPRITI